MFVGFFIPKHFAVYFSKTFSAFSLILIPFFLLNKREAETFDMSETKSTNSANKEISMNAAQLKTFLTDAPLTYKSKLQPQAEKYILTQCYRSLWSDDSRWLQAYFFPEGDSDNLPLLLEKYNLIGSKKQDLSDNKSEGDQSLDDTDEEEYWENQRGKQCGRLFKRGESVYHCR